MKLLVILMLFGFSQAVPATEFGSFRNVKWEQSLWNWFGDETDIRGPRMKCIELSLVLSAEANKDSIDEDYKSDTNIFAKEKYKDVAYDVASFRSDLKVEQTFLKNFLGLYDNAVMECRTDEKFIIYEYAKKYLALLSGLSDSALEEMLSRMKKNETLATVDEIATIEENDNKKQAKQEIDENSENENENKQKIDNLCQQIKENPLFDLQTCAKKHFDFQVYEEKGMCGINYKKMIECLEDIFHKCHQTDNSSRHKIFGSVAFRFFYDMCNP